MVVRYQLRPADRLSTKVRKRRVSPVAVRPSEGLVCDHIAGSQPWRRERVFVPPFPPLARAVRIGPGALDSPVLRLSFAYMNAVLSLILRLSSHHHDTTWPFVPRPFGTTPHWTNPLAPSCA